MKSNKGITITTLVITVIVLLILTSISVSVLINKDGILNNVDDSKQNAEINSIESKLQMELVSFNMKNGKYGNIDKYIEELLNINELQIVKNIVDGVNIKNLEEIIVNEKYVFEIKEDEEEGIEIRYIGLIDDLPPRIIAYGMEIVDDKATITIKTIRNEGGEIEYYIKENADFDLKATIKDNQGENQYTFQGIENNKKYTIQVIAKNSKGESSPLKIRIMPITFKHNPTDWTNGDVIVTASTSIRRYTIQTSKDGKRWITNPSQTFTENGTMYARLWDERNTIAYTTEEVANIDKLAPNEFTPTATSTTNSITVTASTTDAEAANGSGKSGIAGYRFSLDNGSTWTSYQTSGTYTWDNLPQTTNYTIKIEAKDNAGNTKQGSVSAGTEKVTDLASANVTFTYNPSGWTSGSVKVTAALKDMTSSYTLKITDSNPVEANKSTALGWANASTGITVSSNKNVYAVLVDSEGQTGAAVTGSVTNIDTAAPVINTALSGTGTTNSITLSMAVSDTQSGVNKIIWYYKLSTDSSYTSETDNYTSTTTNTTRTHTFTGLTQGKTYNAYAVVYDAVGRTKRSSTINVSTGKVTDLASANVTFTYNPSGWTSGSVKVTAALKDMTSSYTLKITDSNPSGANKSTALGWANASTGITVSSNKTVYAVLVDSEGQTGAAATGNVTNIDKVAPTINSSSIDYIELREADDNKKSQFGYKTSVPSNTAMQDYTESIKLNAGEIFYCSDTEKYYMCIKSTDEAGTRIPFTSTEYFKDIGSVYRVGLKFTINATDEDSGISNYYFSKDGGSTWVGYTTTATSKTYIPTSLTQGSTYKCLIKVKDKAGNEKSTTVLTRRLTEDVKMNVTASQVVANPTEYYGKTVTDYKATNGHSGWKIFYASGSDVFLIADDYVPNKLIDTTKTGMTRDGGGYKAYWTSVPSLDSTDSSINQLFLYEHSSELTSIYTNAKVVSKLLNKSNWTGFVDSSKADYAIGGTTLEMWIKSWNNLYPSDKLYYSWYNSGSNRGYQVGTSTNSLNHTIDYSVMNQKEGYRNSLYYITNNTKAGSYWQASPSCYGNTHLRGIEYRGYVGTGPYNTDYTGIRPVVHIKTNTSLEILK